MSEIAELERRITAALDRIRRGLEDRPAPAPEPVAEPEPAPAPEPVEDLSGEVARLEAELEEERTASAQLEERVRALKERQDGRIGKLEAEARAARDRAGALDAALDGLRQSNADLAAACEELRRAAAGGLPDEALVNRAMQAELESAQARQAADRAELDAILEELRPIVEEAT